MSIVFVIPCRNEAPRISNVLNTVTKFKAKSAEPVHVIVVNDHSTDNSKQVTEKNFPHVTVIDNPGRGLKQALLNGFDEAFKKKPKIIVTLDTDLTGLKASHLASLINDAHKSGLAVGVLPHFLRGRFDSIKNLRIESSGQRAYNAAKLKKILGNPEIQKKLKNSPQYGSSVLLYNLFKSNFGRPKSVSFDGVGHVSKKTKGKNGVIRNFNMFIHQLRYKCMARRIK